MTNFHAMDRRSEQGFTLVELAIVMVIIGLLIGGILKGQELIANARITSTVSQVKGLDAGLNTFQDKFNGLPGDIANPGTRLPSCTATCATAPTTVNGRYDNAPGVVPAIGLEGVVAFAQMGAADLLSNVSSTSTTVTEVLPSVSSGGTMWLGTTTAAGAATANVLALQGSRTYLALSRPEVVSGTSGAFTVTQAGQLDRKMDDGLPNAGTTQAVCGAGATSGGTAASTYNENITGATCALYVRVLN